MEKEDHGDDSFVLPSLPGVPKTPPEILRQMTESPDTDAFGKDEENPEIPSIPDPGFITDPDFVHQFPVPSNSSFPPVPNHMQAFKMVGTTIVPVIPPTPMKPVKKTPKGKKQREPEPLGPFGVPLLKKNGDVRLKELIERMDAELLACGEKTVANNPIMFNTMLKKFLDIKEPPISLDTLENHWKNMNNLDQQNIAGRLDVGKPWHSCQMIDRTKLKKTMPKLKETGDSFWQVVSRVNYELGACGCACVEKNPMVFVYMLQELSDHFTMPVDFNDFLNFWSDLKWFDKARVAKCLNNAEPWIV